MKELSILIPTFNDKCVALVQALQQQANLLGSHYEIIVADDGSTDSQVLQANRAINELSNCQVIERKENCGRAAIRNFLAQQAHFPWLLFVDSDMVVCREDFLQCYATTADSDLVVDGGVCIGKVVPGNLRSLYEKAAEKEHTAEKRRLTPYQHLHTANLFMHRDVIGQHPFDERFRHYGYEDVLLGKELEKAAIPILHIDNPVSFEIYESNEHFLGKTEEALRTLYQFRDELTGYSHLLKVAERLKPVAPIILSLHHRNKGRERRNLVGPTPSLKVFSLYRLGYFMSLQK